MASKKAAPAPAKKAPAKKATASKAPGKAVQPYNGKNAGAVSIFEMDPSMLIQDQGAGLQNIRSTDMSIPFLMIVQALSPQRKKTNDKYIPGCEEGMIFNTLDKTCYEDVLFVPCHYDRSVIEWKPRDSGGGFVARHDRDFIMPETKTEKGTPYDPETGHEFVESVEYSGLVLDPDRDEPYACIIAMSGSGHKHSKKWNTVMMQRKETVNGKRITPPLYAYAYRIGTQPEQNKAGQDYFAWSIELTGEPVSRDVYMMARDLSSSVASMSRSAVDSGYANNHSAADSAM